MVAESGLVKDIRMELTRASSEKVTDLWQIEVLDGGVRRKGTHTHGGIVLRSGIMRETMKSLIME